MRVLLIGDVSGTRNGQAWPPRGSTIELPDDEAAILCQQRMATPVVEGNVEYAVLDGSDVEKRAVTSADPEVESAGPLTTESAGSAVSRRERRRGNTGPA